MVEIVAPTRAIGELLSNSDGPRGASAIASFEANYSYEDCTMRQLYLLSGLAERTGRLDIAREAARRIIQDGREAHLGYCKLGWIETNSRNHEGALTHFAAGTQAEPGYAPNWLCAARAAHTLGRKEEARDLATRYASLDRKPHSSENLTVLVNIADQLFTSRQRAASKPIYEFLVKFAPFRAQTIVRLAECHISEFSFAVAGQLLEPLAANETIDVWGKRALAICRSRCGQLASAISLAREVAATVPRDQGFVDTYLDVLVRARDADALQFALEHEAGLWNPAGRVELNGRLALLRGDLHASFGRLLQLKIAASNRPFTFCVEIGYAAIRAGRPDIALVAADLLLEAVPGVMQASLIQIDSYFHMQDWESASAVLNQLPEADRDKPHFLLKRFECACFVQDRETAASLAAELEQLDSRPPSFLPAILRFLAEQKSWESLVDRALEGLDGSFMYEQAGYVLFRAAHQTGRSSEIVAAIEHISSWQTSPDLTRLRRELQLGAATTLEQLDKLAETLQAEGKSLLHRRVLIQARIARNAERGAKRMAVYSCSDANYLCSTFVALHTAANYIDRKSTDFHIVVDDDVAEFALSCAENFMKAGINLEIIPASRIVAETARLHPKYGIFTSGHMLATAAYYRIFFAQHLQALGIYDRALYIDSDVLVRKPLEPLLKTPLGQCSLAARLETNKPEVRRAIKHHKLANNQYFNSGVLLFDLAHIDVTARLEQAVAAIHDDETTLLFHDQCALNLGFRECFVPLDINWNYPVVHASSIEGLPPAAAILHFLDRPKPWSAAYAGETSLLWYEAWYETASLIGERKALNLYALAAN